MILLVTFFLLVISQLHSSGAIAGDTSGQNTSATAADSTETETAKAKAYDYHTRGIILDSKGDHDGAIAEFTEAIRLKPNFVEALINRGAAYRQKREYDLASADYENALRQRPNESAALVGRGRVHHEKGAVDHAISDYTAALKINAKDAMAYRLRGEAYFQKDNLTFAWDDLAEAIRYQPRYADFVIQEITRRASAKLGQENVDVLNGSDQAFMAKGVKDLLDNKYESAIISFNEALA